MDKVISLDYACKKIRMARKRYGRLKKCEFHLHTPASHDYRLIKDKDYSELTTSDLLDIAVDENYMTKEMQSALLEKIDISKSDLDISAEPSSPYSCLKEQIAFYLIIHKLFQEKVEIVVISDHNTISGFEKLKYARDNYYLRFKKSLNNININILLGVEITCSERNHVVGIFDHRNIAQVQSFLNEIIMKENEGTYQTSLDIIQMIDKIGGIGYIAHVNTAQWWSKAYNNALLNCPCLKVMGFTNYENARKNVEKNNCTREFCYIKEGDSHEIGEIGVNNVWIKCSTINFNGIKRAINDYKICIYNDYPEKSNKYIDGILIVSGANGFLINAPNRVTKDDYTSKDFVVGFSRDLNCIIGGRGTGKSTLLHVLESVFNIDYVNNNPDFLHVAMHEMIYALFHCNGKEYIVRFLPQIDENGNFLNKAYSMDSEGNKILSEHWFEIYEINKSKKNQLIFEKLTNDIATNLLKRNFYRRGYSINKLVSSIDEGSIGAFIKDTVLYGLPRPLFHYVDNIKDLFEKPNYIAYLRDNFHHMLEASAGQKKQIYDIIKQFNSQHKDTLQILYAPATKHSSHYLGSMLKYVFSAQIPITLLIREQNRKRKTYLTWSDIGLFIVKISEKMGYLKFLDCLFHRRYREIEKYDSIANYASIYKTINTIQNDYLDITPAIYPLIYTALYYKLTSNKFELLKSIESYFEVIDDFTLLFNVNKKESVTKNRILMKPISELSLGQKVVALLTFVFEFGQFVGDNSPLILDQPEDNLDNQYIFQNLVESLRSIKNKRQVIIVTHSSTIVTNADAEQVIVMGSDNHLGWIDSAGYPTASVIVKHIVNHLEGGTLSFKNKYDKYKCYIDSLTNN